MRDRHNHRQHQLGHAGENRRRIALEAARLMTEQGIRDFAHAKRKAADRLGLHDEASMPRNAEIEAALREHQRLFQADTQPALLRRLRESAREAMRFFAGFEPRLVGAVLDGSADVHSAICLHLHGDEPQVLLDLLHTHGIPFEEQTRRLRFGPESAESFPVYLFNAGDTAIDLTLLPRDRLRQAPLDRVDDRPLQRASLAALDALLADQKTALG